MTICSRNLKPPAAKLPVLVALSVYLGLLWVIPAYPQTVEADLEAARARLQRGVLLARSGENEEAKRIFEELTELWPDAPEPVSNLAVMYALEGDYAGAAELLSAGIRSHPSYRVALDNLNDIYRQMANQAYSAALGDDIEAPVPQLKLLNGLSRMERSSGLGSVIELPVNPVLGEAQSVPEARPQESAGFTGSSGPGVREIPITEAQFAEALSFPAQVGSTDAEAMVMAWAEAWSDQRADDYLGFYADSFVVPRGMDRAAWERQRRLRVESPERISVSISELRAEMRSPTSAVAHLVQAYESASYRDVVRKTLYLIWQDSWKILREAVE